jgi:hypothetical protein
LNSIKLIPALLIVASGTLQLLLGNTHMAMLFHCTFAASAFTAACCVCLLAIFNGTFRSQCIDSTASGAGSNDMRAIVVLFMAAAALAFVANARLF